LGDALSRIERLELTDSLPVIPGSAGDSGVVTADTWMTRAEAAFDREDFERALACFSRALQLDVNIPTAWSGQIRCLVALGEIPEAITWSKRAQERFPQSPDVLAARAMAECRAGRLADAMGFADSAICSRNAPPFAWSARGDVLLKVRPSNARPCFDKAIELAEDKSRARKTAATSLIEYGQYHIAAEYLREVVRTDPTDAPAWLALGRSQAGMGDTSEAVRCAKRALQVDPGWIAAREALYDFQNRGLLRKTWLKFRNLLRFPKGAG